MPNITAPKNPNWGVLIPVLAAMSFGLYPAAAQVAYLEGANAPFVVITTTFFRAAALILFCTITGRNLFASSGHYKPVFLGGFLQAAAVFGIMGSLLYLPGPVAIVVVFTFPFMLLLFMGFRGEIDLTPLAVLATLSALLGVALTVNIFQSLSFFQLTGIALALLAAVCTMLRLYIFGKELEQHDPAVFGARIFALALVFTLLIIPIEMPVSPTSLRGYLGILLCCAPMVLGTFCIFYGISLCGTFKFSLIAKLEPVFTSLFSWLVLDQSLEPIQYAGMTLVVVSLVCYQYYSSNGQKEL